MTAAAQIVAWLAALSQNDRSSKGDLIFRGPFGKLVSVGLEGVPPEALAGCLPLFTLASGYLPTWATAEGQPRLTARAHSTSLGSQGQGGPISPL